jgi:hypothetical protein
MYIFVNKATCITTNLFVNCLSIGSGTDNGFLLLENGGYYLLEDSGRIYGE